jgi:sensor histidine kinase YesM
VVLLQLFKSAEGISPVDHVYTALFLTTLLPAIYLNLELFLPKLATRKLWLRYALILLACIVLFSWLNQQLFDNWSVILFKDFYFISYYSFWEILAFFITAICLTTLIKLSKSWFVINELQQQVLVLEKERVDMELSALKAQINPHFFFNTLNSIYAMALSRDDQLPATVLRLSGIMRYYLYESKDIQVPLEKEVEILSSYIQLQRIRSTEKLDLRWEIEGSPEGKKIAPMLLLTLVENAFKHGAKTVGDTSFIHMQLACTIDQIVFEVVNSKGEIDKTLHTEEGLGLTNLKRRLELIYPGRHELAINDDQRNFRVHLKIEV